MTIKKTSATGYAVIMDTVMSDGNLRADYDMHLDGRTLRSFERPGHIRTGGLLKINLGSISFPKVAKMAIGDTATF